MIPRRIILTTGANACHSGGLLALSLSPFPFNNKNSSPAYSFNLFFANFRVQKHFSGTKKPLKPSKIIFLKFWNFFYEKCVLKGLPRATGRALMFLLLCCRPLHLLPIIPNFYSTRVEVANELLIGLSASERERDIRIPVTIRRRFSFLLRGGWKFSPKPDCRKVAT